MNVRTVEFVVLNTPPKIFDRHGH